ncbi:uncharacterized protein PV07_02724 [Cladophialophora immunda]|uniref:BTB domain-containing protein n=1 Tax=Cladophialophora immunda TaxID=569365 RepID=A0A0D2CLZ0_9EURO|nr:uncharacterized protein PV07_02724 [Cladophialophora immunda]KIW31040.1 hypothetical protein PV07_02724 [Cladophialophora immunda]OQV05911.1 hypothetical protein CLAIMM_10567 [Cladophialophora immunda]
MSQYNLTFFLIPVLNLRVDPPFYLFTCLMEPGDSQTSDNPRKNLFDYTNVVTFAAGTGSNRQFFSFDEPRLCHESTYFEDRLHGDCPEARTRHFDFADVDPAVLACMLSWYRGWNCVCCDEDGEHIKETYLLAERCGIPRLKEHLANKMQERTSTTDMGKAQDDSPLRLCGGDQRKVPASDPSPLPSQSEIKGSEERDNRPHSPSGQGKKVS